MSEVRGAEAEDADEAELLADDGGDEIGVRLGQVEHLQAAPEAEPQRAARAEAHDRLERLVGDVLAVLVHVEPREVPLACGTPRSR